ncbi:hypothetical protein L7F22_031415 [Adiantum nelumboides]|nr:hypothetical protein [Adiantum nelumboides]
MLAVVSTILQQVNHTNQSSISYLSSAHNQGQRTDSKICPRSFSGLPSEDVLTWLDHLANVTEYHQWDEQCKALEIRTLLDGVVATWFMQQPPQIKGYSTTLSVKDQGTTTFNDAVQIAQRIENSSRPEAIPTPSQPIIPGQILQDHPTPMEIDVQNA